jgi:hypothetical protein
VSLKGSQKKKHKKGQMRETPPNIKRGEVFASRRKDQVEREDWSLSRTRRRLRLIRSKLRLKRQYLLELEVGTRFESDHVFAQVLYNPLLNIL